MGHTLVTQLGQGTHIPFKHYNTRFCNTWPCRCGIKSKQ